jgi:hypothetical protein
MNFWPSFGRNFQSLFCNFYGHRGFDVFHSSRHFLCVCGPFIGFICATFLAQTFGAFSVPNFRGFFCPFSGPLVRGFHLAFLWLVWPGYVPVGSCSRLWFIDFTWPFMVYGPPFLASIAVAALSCNGFLVICGTSMSLWFPPPMCSARSVESLSSVAYNGEMLFRDFIVVRQSVIRGRYSSLWRVFRSPETPWNWPKLF